MNILEPGFSASHALRFDFESTPTRTDEERCPVQSQFCDFEEDLCLWKQDRKDDFDWKIWHGRTPSSDTGPSLDHTLIRANSMNCSGGTHFARK